jgi:hypothetical protein
MNPGEKKIWFPAKKYGWGWGPPCCWQGWIFLLAWLTALYGGAYVFRPDKHLALFLVHVGVCATVLIVVCVLKGEKPGWRWGGK